MLTLMRKVKKDEWMNGNNKTGRNYAKIWEAANV